MKSMIVPLVAATLAVTPALAGDDIHAVESTGAFADVAQSVNDAIVNRGYAVDYHGFIGEMLKRTAGDVGATKEIYKDAEFFTFCSAVASRKVMEAEPADIAYCPYAVFVYERADAPGKVTVAFRKLPAGGARDEINAMLGDIAAEAAGK